ncbi:MAG: hypothetical protein IJ801_02350 [Lachnospiraceae bacterium]|nr:hypothetical protein [Lachnospiraceae bacterium]
MSEKLAEVYEQYEMEILSTRKGRGATILTTTEGLRMLEPFRGSVTRLEQEYILKRLFRERGCTNLDDLIPNREGMLLTCDKYRQPYVLKKHFEGNECDMHDRRDIVRAVEAMASFHIEGKEVALHFKEAWQREQKEKECRRIEEIRKAVADGEELERIAYVYELSPGALEEILREQEAAAEQTAESHRNTAAEVDADKEMEQTFWRHNRELKKIQRFINRVKRKNTFENLFLQVFPHYYEQGMECARMLLELQSGQQGSPANQVFQSHYGICHGAYNHHNVILGEAQTAIVHFERFSKGNQLNDLYQFARKAMEKNHFEFELLKVIFETYEKQIALSKADYEYMYILFSYPEKFWKIANGYYNANKAFLSPKYVEKLEMVIQQENEKKKMLSEYYAFHFGEY